MTDDWKSDLIVAIMILGIIASLCFGCGSCEARRVEAKYKLTESLLQQGKNASEIKDILHSIEK